MKKHFSWKKATAFAMSMALVSGAMPVSAGGFFNACSGIVANAAEEAKAPALGAFYKVGDTIAISGETWFMVDDDPNSGYAKGMVSSNITITAYEYSKNDNQYVWKTGETMFTAVHNGFYVTSKDASVQPEGFYITGGKGTENDPYVIGITAPKFSGENITLDDGIGMNFIVGNVDENNADDLKIKLTGDCDEGGNTLHSLVTKTINGEEVYCVTANVAANKMNTKITADLYYGDNAAPIDTLAFSVNDYLDAVDTKDNAKLEALVKATKQYGKVSEAYFGNGALPEVKDHSDEILNSNITYSMGEFGEFVINKYKPGFETSEAAISLVLDSKLAVRLYTAKYEQELHDTAAFDIWTFDENNKLVISPFTEIYAFEGANGRMCFEVPGITPAQLGTTFNVNYLGTDYLFTPMAWSYRVMSNENASAKNVTMANALYEYYIAAADYIAK
ncbi:MAG: hypothetical protein J6X56_09025 [Ruminococcus sp.]|nr:hypothetical protein [Ruminococcus sp.]